MNSRLLQEIGLTEGESKVYFALVKLGTTKTGALASEAQVSTSKVYKILDKLEKKGLAGHIIKGKIKYFSATSPRRILDYINEKESELESKKKEVEKMIPQIQSMMGKTGKSEAAIYNGFRAVTNLFRSMIDELEKGEEYYVIGANYGEVSGLREFFYSHHKRRADKGIKVNMLANYNTKANLEKTTRLKSEIRFLPQYLISNMQIVFYREKVLIIVWKKSPLGFFLEDREAVAGFRTYFEALWKLAKK